MGTSPRYSTGFTYLSKVFRVKTGEIHFQISQDPVCRNLLLLKISVELISRNAKSGSAHACKGLQYEQNHFQLAMEEAQSMAAADSFPKVSHVRQESYTDELWNLTEKDLKFRKIDFDFGADVSVLVSRKFRLNLDFSAAGREHQPGSVQRLTKEQVWYFLPNSL